MPLRTTEEVIRGAVVIRYNGNNCTGTRSSGRPVARPESVRSEKITAWRKRKAKEAEYTRRYLGGEG